jgi:two-component system LytT family response regulator
MVAQQVGWQFSLIAGYALFFLYSIALTDLLRREMRRRQWLCTLTFRASLRLFVAALAIAAIQTFLVFAIDLLFHGRASLVFRSPAYAIPTWISVSSPQLHLAALLCSAHFGTAISRKGSQAAIGAARGGIARARGANQSALPVQLPQLHPRAGGGESTCRAGQDYAFRQHSSLQPGGGFGSPAAALGAGAAGTGFVRDGERCWIVRLPDIFLMESEGNYTRLYFGNERPLIRRSLNALEEQLDPAMFFRAGRKEILNLKCIEKVDLSVAGGLVVSLRGGRTVEMSRRQSLRLREILSL